jgi:hypothetical protein
MILKTMTAILIAGLLATLSCSAHATKLSNDHDELKLKPAKSESCYLMNSYQITMASSEYKLLRPDTYAYCQNHYLRCTQRYGSKRIGPSMTQCGDWLIKCLTYGYWPGLLFRESYHN